MQNKIICDTNVVSSAFRKDKYFNVNALKKLNQIGVENILITPVIYIELIRWLSIYKGITTSERKKFKQLFNDFEVLHLNRNISILSMEIAQKRDHLASADTLIGATAVYYDVPLFTFNIKDFKSIKGLKLIK